MLTIKIFIDYLAYVRHEMNISYITTQSSQRFSEVGISPHLTDGETEAGGCRGLE